MISQRSKLSPKFASCSLCNVSIEQASLRKKLKLVCFCCVSVGLLVSYEAMKKVVVHFVIVVLYGLVTTENNANSEPNGDW